MNRSLFEYDKDIGYRFIPNLKTRVHNDSGGYLVKVNAQGFRNNQDFIEEKKSERIIVFGDSFTAGDGVSNGKRYTDLLERNTGKQVYNLGLSGTGTDQQYLIYKKFAQNLNTDLYIITVLVENIRRVNSKYRFYYDADHNMICYPKPYYTIVNDKLNLQHHPVPNETYQYQDLDKEEQEKVDTGGQHMGLRKLINKLGIKKLVQQNLKIQPFSEYNSPDNHEWILMKEILKKWIKELNKPVFIIPLPTYHYIEGLATAEHYQKRFQELQKETSATIIDPLPYFASFDKDVKRKFRFEKDIHLTKLGHETLADFITKELNKN